MNSCEGHGLLLGRACYWHAKQMILAGRPVPDEVRIFVGIGVPARPAEDGWRPIDVDSIAAAAALERRQAAKLGDVGRSLAAALDAIRRIGEAS